MMWKMIVQRIIIGWCVIADGEVCCVSISNKRYKNFLPTFPSAIKIFSKAGPVLYCLDQVKLNPSFIF